MKVYALLSYYDEKPEHLARCVGSLAGFVDHLIAVDGRYETFSTEPIYGGTGAAEMTIADAATFPVTMTARRVWASEVAKRAAMFHYGNFAGATPRDWFLIIDADMALAEFSSDARELLAVTDRDVAEVCFQTVQVDGKVAATCRFRSMFRALPGLTVERTHYLYTVPCEYCESPCGGHCGMGRRFLWLMPDGHPSPEPTLNLFGDVTLQHFNSSRDGTRKRHALDYYKSRDAAGFESVGDWR